MHLGQVFQSQKLWDTDFFSLICDKYNKRSEISLNMTSEGKTNYQSYK